MPRDDLIGRLSTTTLLLKTMRMAFLLLSNRNWTYKPAILGAITLDSGRL